MFGLVSLDMMLALEDDAALDQAFDLLRAAEREDSDGRQCPCAKRSDDASFARVRVSV